MLITDPANENLRGFHILVGEVWGDSATRRKRVRMKHLVWVHTWGITNFSQIVQRYLRGEPLPPLMRDKGAGGILWRELDQGESLLHQCVLGLSL